MQDPRPSETSTSPGSRIPPAPPCAPCAASPVMPPRARAAACRPRASSGTNRNPKSQYAVLDADRGLEEEDACPRRRRTSPARYRRPRPACRSPAAAAPARAPRPVQADQRGQCTTPVRMLPISCSARVARCSDSRVGAEQAAQRRRPTPSGARAAGWPGRRRHGRQDGGDGGLERAEPLGRLELERAPAPTCRHADVDRTADRASGERGGGVAGADVRDLLDRPTARCSVYSGRMLMAIRQPLRACGTIAIECRRSGRSGRRRARRRRRRARADVRDGRQRARDELLLADEPARRPARPASRRGVARRRRGRGRVDRSRRPAARRGRAAAGSGRAGRSPCCAARSSAGVVGDRGSSAPRGRAAARRARRPTSTSSAGRIASDSGRRIVAHDPLPDLGRDRRQSPPRLRTIVRTASMPTPRPEMSVVTAAVEKPGAEQQLDGLLDAQRRPPPRARSARARRRSRRPSPGRRRGRRRGRG